MPKCKSCGKQWGWKDTVKSSLATGVKGMVCPYCKKQQYLTAKSKKRCTMYMFFIISPLALFYNSSVTFGFIALIAACMLYMAIWPSLVELSNQEDSKK